MKKKLSRRDVIKGMATFIGGAVLASCAPKTDQTFEPTKAVKSLPATVPPSTETKEVVYWINGHQVILISYGMNSKNCLNTPRLWAITVLLA